MSVPASAAGTEVQHASDAGPFYVEPEFWVGAGFVILMAIFIYLGVHKSATMAIDARSAKIKADLDAAAKLRSDAEALLAAAEARFANSATEASAIVEQARRNAEEIAVQGARDLDALIARRTKGAEDRIAAAQRAAEASLRAQTVDMATAQARTMLAGDAGAGVQDRLVDAAIADLARVR